MKAGTIIELPDGRRGTVVYHGLDGYGIKWGELTLTEEALDVIMHGDGNTFQRGQEHEWNPEAMLREPYPGADCECVGDEYTKIKEPQP